MTHKLKDDDRQAVDLVLDTLARAGSADEAVAVSGTPGEARVQSVEQILSALAQMPAPEPAPDLVERTLARIERATNLSAAPQPAPAVRPDHLPA